ncbi:DUF1315 family protein [Xenorhabdus nematophila]|uniref:YeaC family protein n=1 Tax=Xenorhabdus nematophila TaxID=628 RepID=UPI0005436EF8|nr:DUF1315 family protein [Xenorhabdus nematophila]CEF32965.1 conserved hypothetical protein [Xenorhabdus nematophila str. Websteri]AYA40085.1 DUF1315 family protein [Xenorhabdus nematophila]KHD29511.1 transcriptional regulator [Xenorhabdus nematophila]MBA0018732.1 DUF1315 family protein [Xenorhabdus nematophila]MCB4425302.1 DUF1315 family protein [Xenorhabdus nematophila]
MKLDDLLSAMTPEIYQRLVQAVELGKWQDGIPLTPEQKEHSLQAVMLWQAKHNHHPEHMTIGTNGEITLKSKQELKATFRSEMVAKLKPQSEE